MKRSSVVLRARSSAAIRFAADLPAIRSRPATASDVELEQIGRRADQATIDELIDDLVSESFDIERTPAGEVQQRLLALRSAHKASGAPADRFAFFTINARPAHRASRRHPEHPRVTSACAQEPLRRPRESHRLRVAR